MPDLTVPDEIREPVRRLLAAMVSGAASALGEVFTDDAVVLDSFTPYVFEGRAGVARWFADFGRHTAEHVDLHATLGEPQEFSVDGRTAFYSQPVTWTFGLGGHQVVETGGLAVLLAGAEGRWRIRRTAWAVVTLDVG